MDASQNLIVPVSCSQHALSTQDVDLMLVLVLIQWSMPIPLNSVQSKCETLRAMSLINQVSHIDLGCPRLPQILNWNAARVDHENALRILGLVCQILSPEMKISTNFL